ncbi:hypothetical protein PIB30_010456 [Stylosanthes scabra]|uniref:Uncharacterized protein n=1 Tax=Stylosanthes scabra TaxID=79078 RepID=A0ABU6Y272_9FABA|nr:hypothetical protein [Stylosanthes scabra]
MPFKYANHYLDSLRRRIYEWLKSLCICEECFQMINQKKQKQTQHSSHFLIISHFSLNKNQDDESGQTQLRAMKGVRVTPIPHSTSRKRVWFPLNKVKLTFVTGASFKNQTEQSDMLCFYHRC